MTRQWKEDSCYDTGVPKQRYERRLPSNAIINKNHKLPTLRNIETNLFPAIRAKGCTWQQIFPNSSPFPTIPPPIAYCSPPCALGDGKHHCGTEGDITLHHPVHRVGIPSLKGFPRQTILPHSSPFFFDLRLQPNFTIAPSQNYPR